MLSLINNSLINCAGTNSSNFTMILSFYHSKSHPFQNPKKTDFPGFLFSATRNPGFKILPRIGNTSSGTLYNATCLQIMTGSDSKNQKMPRMRDRIRSDCFGPDHIGIFRKEDPHCAHFCKLEWLSVCRRRETGGNAIITKTSLCLVSWRRVCQTP